VSIKIICRFICTYSDVSINIIIFVAGIVPQYTDSTPSLHDVDSNGTNWLQRFS